MYFVFNNVVNKATGDRYELMTRRFKTFDDAQKYIKDKTDKYTEFCIHEIGCDSYIEDYYDSTFFNFLGMRIVFDIMNVDYDF